MRKQLLDLELPMLTRVGQHMKRSIFILLGFTIVLVGLIQNPTVKEFPSLSPAAAVSKEREAVVQTLAQLPLYFIENQGQVDEQVAYYLQGRDTAVYFTNAGVTVAQTAPTTLPADEERLDAPAGQAERWSIKLDFVGANPDVYPVGQERTAAVVSYFKGQREDWDAGLATYGRIVYPELWPGIDLVYEGTGSQLKYSFIVQPGADPGQIQLAYRGATGVTVNAAGQMEVRTPLGGFTDEKPLAYQVIDGEQLPVKMAYVLDAATVDNMRRTHTGKQAAGTPTQPFHFHIGSYDRERPLILDPVMYIYAGYIGGVGDEYGGDIAVDGTGNVYVTGGTYSDETTFPVQVGPDLAFNGGLTDAFVAKVSSSGDALVYAGYIGGDNNESGWDIAVDGTGSAYITGATDSDETTFPVLIGPDLTFNGGIVDAFVAKVNSSGDALLYAGYLGGVEGDWGYGIVVDGTGSAFVAGTTESDEATFPVLVGPNLTFNGNQDTFVAKVSSSGNALVYAGYIGGAGSDEASAIAVDGTGNAYVAGATESNETTFPVLVGPDLTFNGGSDAFVAKVNSSGDALLYAGYIGGTSGDFGQDIALDDSSHAYITGATFSSETSFPVLMGPDLTHNGSSDGFVAKISDGGNALVYAGYIGGTNYDSGSGIAVDGTDNVYITGFTASNETSFPVLDGPDLTFNGGSFDAFVAKVSGNGSALLYAGYIGGANADNGNGIALDGAGNAYIRGSTESDEASFPVLIGPDLTHNGSLDVFVVKLGDSVISKAGPLTAAAGQLITYTLQINNNLPVTLTGVIITDTIPINATYIGGGTQVGNIVSWTVPGLASGESITRQFAVTATETITNHDYRVAASNGFSATGSIPVVTIVQVPVSGLAAANDSPTILGHVSSLTATTTAGSDITYTWAFGDGQVGSGAVVTHTYPATGVYTAVVTASNLVSSLTATTPVTIVDAAIAGLEATNDSPTSWGQLTTLSATITTGANVAYVWNFGDGQLGSGKVVTHTYADAGVYTAIVTASNSVSTITATTNVTIVQPIFTSYLPIVLKPEG